MFVVNGGADMPQFSEKLLNSLSEFLIRRIGSQAIDGITYTMLTKDKKYEKDIKDFMEIRQEATNCGYSGDEVFRVFEVSNGYIFDMDMGTAKKITMKLSESLNKAKTGQAVQVDFIGDLPNKRRDRELSALYRYVSSKINEGQNTLQIALFNTNSTDRIMFTGYNSKNEKVAITYKAFALKYWDLETLNRVKLMPTGYRIAIARLGQILPNLNGVSCELVLEDLRRQ